MRVKVWGARGSVPAPGPEMNRYGGNTSCVEVTLSNGEKLIIDAGTGIRTLGFSQEAESTIALRKATFFISAPSVRDTIAPPRAGQTQAPGAGGARRGPDAARDLSARLRPACGEVLRRESRREPCGPEGP